MQEQVNSLIAQLALEPHPEGGYFREVYRSEARIRANCLPAEFMGDRNFATSIYFLLYASNFSAFHRIRQDEIWHFYAGKTIAIHVIHPNGTYQCQPLGNDIVKGIYPQFVVKAGCWFASEMAQADSYALVGCTVAPGFSFADFELAQRASLCEDFPQHRAIITKLTRT
jgi:hypothetical protein